MKLAGRGVSALAPKVPLPVPEGHLLAGKYRIEKVIGAGGMGVVVSAVHVHLGQRVAIKFLLPHSALDDHTVARFAREARALAQIGSEHVGRVIDVGSLESGEPFTVLERLSGQNLAEIMAARGPLEIGEAVSYVIEACQAMSEAHALGIIHRDLKPENLFLAERADGSKIIKVIDFGVSKIEAEATSPDAPWAVTVTSAVVGSPLYMSPEQLRAARDVDARTDIWSLGVTLYELLTGQGPFQWSTLPELCAAILKDPPRRLRELRSDVPEGLDAVVMSCLERDPSRRPPSAAALAQALRPFSMVGATTVAQGPLSVLSAGRSPLAMSSLAAETMAAQAPLQASPSALPPAVTTNTGAPDVPRRPRPVRPALLLLGGFALGGAVLVTGTWSGPPTIDMAASAPALAGVAIAGAPSAEALARPAIPGPALEAAETVPTVASASASAATPPPDRRTPRAVPSPLQKPAGGRPPRASHPQSAFDHRK